MKRLWYVVLTLSMLFFFSCGKESTVKPTENSSKETSTTTVQPQKQQNQEEKTYSVYGDKLNDTAYSNVIQIFRDAMTTEKESPIPKNIYATGEATVLLIKFFKENMSVKRYGFTQDDIETYKAFAQKKFSDVLNNQNSSDELKTGAQRYLSQLQTM